MGAVCGNGGRHGTCRYRSAPALHSVRRGCNQLKLKYAGVLQMLS